MPHEIAIATQCNHCPRKFYGPRGPLIVGERPQARFASFVAQLGRHITEAHPEVAEQMIALNWEFQGYNLMRHFTTQDPAVRQNEDLFRWKLHQATLRCRAQKLQERAQMVADEICNAISPADDPEQEKAQQALRTLIQMKTYEALEELRQIVEEPDLYVQTPKQPEPEAEKTVS